MAKFCPKCGEELLESANFCKSCGARLNESAARAEVPERPAYEKSYDIHIIAGYVLGLLIPILGVIMSFYLMSRKDSKKAKRHGRYVLILSIVMLAFSFIGKFRY